MTTITIPEKLIKEKDLVVIPRKEYEELLEKQKVTEKDVLRWSKEAKTLKRRGRLPVLRSLRELRSL